MWPCSRCGVQTAHSFTGVRTWFTLFFVPIIPFPMSRRLLCTNCGTRNKFDRSLLPAIEQAAAAGAARAAAIQTAAAQAPGGPMAPPYPDFAPPPSAGVPGLPPPPGYGHPQGPPSVQPSAERQDGSS